jgi:hypothetical protein
MLVKSRRVRQRRLRPQAGCQIQPSCFTPVMAAPTIRRATEADLTANRSSGDWPLMRFATGTLFPERWPLPSTTDGPIRQASGRTRVPNRVELDDGRGHQIRRPPHPSTSVRLLLWEAAGGASGSIDRHVRRGLSETAPGQPQSQAGSLATDGDGAVTVTHWPVLAESRTASMMCADRAPSSNVGSPSRGSPRTAA